MDTNSEEEGYTLEDAIKQSLLSRNKLAMIMQGPNDEIHFSCVECSYKCSEKEQMEQHFLLHNKEYRYLCGICGTGLKRKEHLDRHTLEHQEYRPHICADCGKAFKRKEHMNIHRSIHRGDRNEQCTICHKAFYRKDHLQKHLQTHAKSFIKHNVPPIISEAMVEIKQEFDDEDELPISTYLDYQDVKPNVEDVDYQDQPNGDDFEEQDIKPDIIEFENDGDGNQTMEDDDESAQFIGDGDGMGYVTALSPSQVYVDDGDEEMEAGMESEDLSFNEDLIPKPKRQKVKVKRPERDLSFSQERPYQCYLCHKAYKRRDHLKLHSYTHKEKEKICNVCGKAFSRDPQLRAHMKVHSATYTTNRRGGLKTIQRQTMLYSGQYTEEDIRMMERASKMNGESRPHECTVCQRRFKRKQHLKQHLNVHFKPHQPNVWCSICGEGFDTSERFENHRCTGSEDGSSSRMYIGQTVKHDKKENKYPTEFVSVNLSEPDPAPRVPESELPIPQRVFVCKFCTKPFKRKDHYKIHLHIHTGIKSFFCDTCGKGFYRKDHWQKHVTIHTRAKEMAKQWRQVPALFPIEALPKKKLRSSDKKRTDDTKKTEDQKTAVKPEITIHAPSNSKIRVPLQIKVPYQMVMSMDNGEQRAVTVEPQQSPS